jgi:hypothetical protein
VEAADAVSAVRMARDAAVRCLREDDEDVMGE